MTAPREDRRWAAGLSAAALLLYAFTLAPTVVTVFDDSLEFQVVLPSLGIAHPTGYPLYTILGWLFSLVPLGDAALRVNLFSALAGAATVGLIFLLARILGSSRLAAAAASAIYAVSSIWWSQATIAEVYTLHGFFVALILLLALQLSHPLGPVSDRAPESHAPLGPVFDRAPESRTPLGPVSDRAQNSRLTWLALACGLALAHHRMTLLLFPGLAVFILWNDPGLLRRPRQLGLLLLAFLVPLLLYLYLPLRGLTTTSLDGTFANTWQGFWRHVLASDYGAFLTGNPLAVERSPSYGIDLVSEQIGLAALLLGLVGWLRWPEQPRRWTLLALVFLTNGLFAASYRTADADVFYLPAILVWLLLAAVGLTTLLDQLGALLGSLGRQLRLPGPYKAWLAAVQVALLLILLGQPLQAALRTLNYEPRPRTCAETLAVGESPAFDPNRAGEWSAANCGRAILDLPLPENAVVIGLLGETTLLRYFQQFHGLRPDVRLVTADREPERLTAVAQALAAGQAVYLTRELPGAAERYALDAEGPLIRVSPPGQEPPDAPLRPLDQPMGDAIRLAGYDLAPAPARGALWLRLQLAWAVDAPVGEDLKVSARLLGSDGSVVAAQDAVPVHWAYPTTAWRPGETVIDAYDFALPADADIADLTPLVILYRVSDGTEVGRFRPSS